MQTVYDIQCHKNSAFCVNIEHSNNDIMFLGLFTNTTSAITMHTIIEVRKISRNKVTKCKVFSLTCHSEMVVDKFPCHILSSMSWQPSLFMKSVRSAL